MEKFKKVAKIVGVIAIIIGGIAGTILYSLFPNETAEWVRNAWSFINTPLPIVGVSLVIVGRIVIEVLSMTSFGDKKLSELEKKYESWREEAKRVENHEEELVNNSEVLEAKVDLLLKDYGTSQTGLINIVYELCKTFPNKKVNALGDRIKELYPHTIEEAQEVAYREVESKNEEKQEDEVPVENMGLEKVEETDGVQNG